MIRCTCIKREISAKQRQAERRGGERAHVGLLERLATVVADVCLEFDASQLGDHWADGGQAASSDVLGSLGKEQIERGGVEQLHVRDVLGKVETFLEDDAHLDFVSLHCALELRERGQLVADLLVLLHNLVHLQVEETSQPREAISDRSSKTARDKNKAPSRRT